MQQNAPANPPFPVTAKLDQRTLPCVPPPPPPSLYLTMSYPSNLSASPPTWLGNQSQGLLASIGDDYAHDNAAYPNNTTIIQYHNHNHGRGVVNHVQGNQQIHMNISLNCNPESSLLCDTFPVIEPYQTAVESLVDITQVLSELPRSRTVLTQREQLEGFLKMIVCAAKAMEIIRGRNSRR
ncbi:hypothetical protein BDN71DRAFT_329134 [Pleurotus eryngii]|uniref:Uncharacterized protein n=1 Tax=Pleurotus eryngii TaxID=5323 RepID=A0A9P5ZL92_PLEER|nr:hypothetical protein BDN71DRAFT_329134 [Pleurotus eryngii]